MGRNKPHSIANQKKLSGQIQLVEALFKLRYIIVVYQSIEMSIHGFHLHYQDPCDSDKVYMLVRI